MKALAGNNNGSWEKICRAERIIKLGAYSIHLCSRD